MNATGGVNRPISNSRPPADSRIADRPINEKTCISPIANGGKPKSFEVPCSKNRSPATILRTLNRRGDQADQVASSCISLVLSHDAQKLGARGQNATYFATD